MNRDGLVALPTPRAGAWVRLNVATAAGYLALAAFPSHLFHGVSPLWPPAALGAFAVLCWGGSAMPGVFAGSLAANLFGSRLGLGPALIASAGNALAPLLGRALLQRIGGSPATWWRSPRGTAGFLLTMGMLQPALCALIGVAGLVWLGGMRAGALGQAVDWAIADASAVVMLTPLLQLAWKRRSHRATQAPPARLAQVAGAFALVLLIWALAAGGNALEPAQRTGLLGLLLFPLLGSVFAFDALVTAGLLAFSFVLLTGSAALGLPIVAMASSAQTIVALEFFLLAVGGAVLLASSLQHAHKAALLRLREQAAQLDALARLQARHLAEQQGQMRNQLRRLSDLTGILSSINHLIDTAQDEVGLLQKFCELVVGLQGIALAWVGRPDDAGRFIVLAKAGPAVAYLDDIVINTDAQSPFGRGTAGQAWREQRPMFAHRVRGAPSHLVWAARLEDFGIQATAGLPLLRGGRIWAIFNLFLSFDDGFDASLQKVAEQIATDLSIGLARLDSVRREREQSRINAALLSNMTVGVNVMRYPERTFEHANARLLQMAGAADLRQLASRAARAFYADPDDYARVGELVQEILRDGSGSMQELRYLRADGSLLVLDMTGVRLDLGDGLQRILWTQIDVTQRHQQARQLRQTQGVYRALAAAADSLLQGSTESGMITRLCQSLLDGTQFTAAWLMRPDDEGVFRAVGEAAESAIDLEHLERLRVHVDDAHDAIARAWRARAWRAQDAAMRRDGVAGTAGAPHWASLLAVPVRRGSETWGVLAIAAREAGFFDSTIAGACEQVAALLGHGLDELDRKNALQALQDSESRRARTDALTGLPNRLALDEFLPGAIARSERRQSVLAVGMLDLDNFKPVNDRYGHAVGDVLLQKVAQALRLRLRNTDFLARLGGDEFVIVSEDLDPDHVVLVLGTALERLHTAVETPFDLGDGRRAEVGMTMGLALCPQDAREADTLLRVADAAMYSGKTHKLDRTRWWRIGTGATDQVADSSRELAIDSFGADSRTLLESLDPRMLDDVARSFSVAFYEDLAQEQEQARILRCLSAEELEALKGTQASHLLFLLGSATTREALEANAQRLGRIHALVGVASARMESAFALYEDLLRAQLENALIPSRQRYRVLRVATARLRLDVQTQLASMEQLTARYFALLRTPLRERARWVDVLPDALAALVELPGIRHAIVFRPDEHGVLREEAGAGEGFERLADLLRTRNLYPNLNPSRGLGRGPLAMAWFMRDVQVVDAYRLDERLRPWHELAHEFGWRSAATIPILNGANTDSVLMLFGAFAHQFSSDWARSWLGLLHARIEAQFTATARNHRPIDAEQVRLFRELLYGDGLRMWVQPIVDLRSGAIPRAEALARLQAGDGTIYNPAQFLPAFGEQELHALFRHGLAQTLDFLRGWRDAGLQVDVAVNLPPPTLMHAQCASWIEEALRKAGVDAGHLTLEVLETDGIDEARSDEAIRAIDALGVRLALDDLGSGYSSVTRLASLPIDTVKVDQGLIRGLPKDPVRTIRLLASLVHLGQEFAPHTVIEGLQDEAYVEVAQQLGARLGQGFALSRPMPAAEFLEWARRRPLLAAGGNQPLRTWPGALAHFWANARDPLRLHPACPIEQCPLTRFLQEHGVDDTRVLGWHERIHDGDAAQVAEATESMLQWMAAQVARACESPS